MGSSSSDLKGSEPRNARRQAVPAAQIVKFRAGKELVERDDLSCCCPVPSLFPYKQPSRIFLGEQKKAEPHALHCARTHTLALVLGVITEERRIRRKQSRQPYEHSHVKVLQIEELKNTTLSPRPNWSRIDRRPLLTPIN